MRRRRPIGAQVAELGQEQIAGEEPAALGLEEADVIRAVAGGMNDLKGRLRVTACCLTAQPGPAAGGPRRSAGTAPARSPPRSGTPRGEPGPQLAPGQQGCGGAHGSP